MRLNLFLRAHLEILCMAESLDLEEEEEEFSPRLTHFTNILFNTILLGVGEEEEEEEA